MTFLVSRRHLLWATGFLISSCRPGLGAQLASRDFAHTFTQRDLSAIRSLSTDSFRHAVWDRVSNQEFPTIARMMGHGRPMDVVDTLFDCDRAIIQMRAEDKKQFRLHLLRLNDDWLVEDVLEELEPAVYISKRQYVEAVLAIRDFRSAIETMDGSQLESSSSLGFSEEVWRAMTPADQHRLQEQGKAMVLASVGEIGEIRVAEDGAPSAAVQGADGTYVFYFSKERGRLVVDDVAIPQGPPSLRVRLRNEISR